MQDRIDRAAERYEARKAEELYRPDGSKLYSDEEHAERAKALDEGFQAELYSIEGDIDQRIAEAQQVIFMAQHSDPSAMLSVEELEFANARRAFVGDEVLALGQEALRGRLRAALATGDRPAMYLYSHFVRARTGEPDIRNDLPGTAELRELAAELDKRLAPEREGNLTQARERIKELEGAKLRLAFRGQGAGSASEAQRNRQLREWGFTRR